MSVKASILLDWISEFNPTYKKYLDKAFNSYSLLHKDIAEFHKDCLYIGKTSWLPSVPPCKDITFILVKDKNVPAYDSIDTECSCIYVDSDTDIWKLFSKIQNCFSNSMYVSDCFNRIIELSNSTSSLQKMLDLGYEILGNPLLLVDASLNFIGHAGGDTVVDEPSWNSILSNGYMPEKYIDSVLLDGMADEENQPQKPLLIWQKNYVNHDQLVYRILRKNSSIAYLKVLQYNKKITKSDQQIITVLGNCLCRFLNNNKIEFASCSSLVASFLLSLLSGNLYDRDIIDIRLHQFNIKLYDNLILIVIELNNVFLHDTDKSLIFRRKLQNLLGRDYILHYNNNLVILYDFKSSQPFTEIEYKNFEKLLRSYECRAGTSFIFHDLYSLSEHYRTARDALYTSQKLNMDKPIVQYSDIVLPHILLNYGNQNDLNSLIHPSILAIKNMEEEKSDMYIETIKAYINNGLKIVPTAKALYAHYNTVKYRLNKIIELTEIDFEDARTIFQLQLSFLILDIQKNIA